MPEPTQKINKLLDKVDEVIQQQKTLAKKQEVILEAVATDEKDDMQIKTEVTTEVNKVDAIAKQITTANTFHENLITRVQKHEFLFPIIIIVGVVLVWKGLWGLFDQLPIVSYSFVSLLLGLSILWIFNRVKSL